MVTRRIHTKNTKTIILSKLQSLTKDMLNMLVFKKIVPLVIFKLTYVTK